MFICRIIEKYDKHFRKRQTLSAIQHIYISVETKLGAAKTNRNGRKSKIEAMHFSYALRSKLKHRKIQTHKRRKKKIWNFYVECVYDLLFFFFTLLFFFVALFFIQIFWIWKNQAGLTPAMYINISFISLAFSNLFQK